MNNPTVKDLTQWQIALQGRDAQADVWLKSALDRFSTFSELFRGHFETVHDEAVSDNSLRAQAEETIADYWAPLGRVAEQRQVGHYRELLDAGTEVYLQKIKPKLIGIQPPGMLLYFDKVSLVRYYPYTNLLLVGTPYRQAVKNDWMAIPHEIGHYVYWRSDGNLRQSRAEHDVLRQELYEALMAHPTIAYLESGTREIVASMFVGWLEETFADVVGTLLGGRDFVDSLQDLLTTGVHNAAALNDGDGVHVLPWLRPLVRECALSSEGLDERLAVWAQFFETNFQHTVFSNLQISLPPQIPFPVDKGQQMTKSKLMAKLGKMRKANLLNIFASLLHYEGEEPGTTAGTMTPPVTLNFEVARALIEQMVNVLKANISQRVDPTRGIHPPDATAGWQELLDLAESQNAVPPYRVLLRPQLLEGAIDHTHDCTTLWITETDRTEHPNLSGHYHAPWSHTKW